MKKDNFKLQFITHSNDLQATVASVSAVLDGGCRWIQLRMKDSSEDEIIEAATVISSVCREYKATFIIDDHVELVKRVGADGVHLGLKDMPIKEARAILGDEYIIGGTANTFQDILQHYNDGVDYIGCGPFRFTSTKKNLSPVLGINGYNSIKLQMEEKGIDIPMVAIGGIGFYDIPQIMSVGVNGVAISGGILKAVNPTDETRGIIAQIEQNIVKQE